jgi:hypothetical protein
MREKENEKVSLSFEWKVFILLTWKENPFGYISCKGM